MHSEVFLKLKENYKYYLEFIPTNACNADVTAIS